MNSPRAPVQVSVRQRKLLGLLAALGGEIGNLDFQKLFYLRCVDLGDEAPYEFVPYKRGAFSFTSYADRRKLIERGLLEDVDSEWKITDQGRQALGADENVHGDFIRRTAPLRGDTLVAETYRRFPFTAIRSEIAAQVLAGDDAALRRIEDAKPRLVGPALFTIGYEGRSLESYLNVLIQAGVSVLCDVRRNPLSRKYGFAKKTLSGACAGVGIRYEHLPELGIASEERRQLVTQEDYDALFDRYEADSLPSQGASIERIAGWMQKGDAVALTCFEGQPQRCHRHCVAEVVEHRFRLRATHL
jgi:hypothetical protein